MKMMMRGLAVLLAALPLVAFGGPVNINTADAETISAELKGIGPSKAKAIIEYRQKHGPFRNPEDLSLVKGIGDRTVELNLANIRVKSDAK